MKVPGFSRATPSRRNPDGWLVRISVRLSRGDKERLGENIEVVREALAVRVVEATRPGDDRSVLARDQYLLVIRPGRRSTDSDDPVPVVRKLLETLAQPIDSPMGPIFPRLNAAFATTPSSAADEGARAALATGLDKAEQAGSGVAIAVDLTGGESQLLTLDTPDTAMISVLKRAIDAEQVVMHYQPVVRLSDGRVTAFEALMRVVDENGKGLVGPAQFIGVAENSGLIHELGRIALRAAAAQMMAWRAAYGTAAPTRIAVNVAPPQLASADFVGEVQTIFAEVGLSALTLELTETAAIQEMPQAYAALEKLREGGAWIALDDFGVEYSNLSYLRDLAVDVVKIDRSFLDGGAQVARAATILAKIVELAHLLDAKVVAEGVASAEQVTALHGIGIDYGQGSHFGLGLEAGDASLLISKRLPA